MATRTTIADGAWSNVGIWDTGKPGVGDTAVIAHNIYIDEDITTGSVTVNAGKLLYVQSSVAGSYTLALSGTITVDGTFRIGDSELSPLSDSRTFTITFSAAAENYITGSLLIYGSPTYHRAGASAQRTRLVADVTAGIGQTFTVDDDVDWSAGDTLWVTTGGDPDHAPTGNEIITITAKISASQYTATFVNNHFGTATVGDIVVHATRNVIINGTNGQGFSFSNYTGAAVADFSIFDISWCRFTYGGKGAGFNARDHLFSFLGVGGHTRRKFFGSIKLRNNVGERSANAGNYPIGLYNFTHNVGDSSYISENHFYLFAGAIICSMNNAGVWLMGPLSTIEATNIGIYSSDGPHFTFDEFLYVSDSSSDSSMRTAISSSPCAGTVRIHRAYCLFNINQNYAAPQSSSGEVHVFDNCQFYNTYDYSTINPPKDNEFCFTSCVFRRHRLSVFRFTEVSMRVYFDNCYFDDCNTFNHPNYGAIQIITAGAPIPSIKMSRCYFGTLSRNYKKNIEVSNLRHSPNRLVMDNCVFVQPINFAPDVSFQWYIPGEYGVGAPNKWLFWAVMPTAQDWIYDGRTGQATETTLEFCNCQFKDAGGTNYWSNMYPLTDRVGIIAGGSEIHKVYQTSEPNGYIDGSFARKLLPFAPTQRLHLTKGYPVFIPTNSGQTVTIKLSFKKNISQSEYRRPRLHLFGCGIDSEATMSDAINTWEELTVSGTATCKGLVELWISCWAVNDYYLTTSPPTRATQHYYAWAYPIDPGGVGYGIGTPSNLVLYADKLDVSYT